MSTTEEVVGAASPVVPNQSRSSAIWKGVDYALSRMGDYLNPILVKETRQALKSRQFTASFWLVLLFAAGWSFVGISLLMPSVYYLPSGRFMLIGYFVILCIPLLLVVPFSAFRSLATECEDGTYELLSITSLSARQIVTGKLGSALLQMMVYYAALAPCIAFTYLLRGMDIGTIAILLIGTFLVSILFCCVGLVFAGMNKSRQWQALSSVLLLLMLIVGGWAWGFWMIFLIDQGSAALNTAGFWQGVGFSLSIYATFVALLILIAAAQNSFASDNRSTKIRITLLLQLILFAGWMIYLWVYYAEGGFAPVALVFAAIAWTIYGAFLTGELAELSPRARRDLPQSFFGRTFLTWFNPGSATGYVFVAGTFLAFVVLILLVNFMAAANSPGMEYDVNDLVPFGILLWAYMAFYLGFGRLIIMGLRRVSDFGVTAVFLIHVLLLTASTAFPTFLQYWLQDFRSADYSYLQMMNWMWSLVETMDGSYLMWPVVATMGLAATAMFCLNLVLAAREIEATRLAAPERVRKDDEVSASLAASTVRSANAIDSVETMDSKTDLSPEADRMLEAALSEHIQKQNALANEWGFDSATQWHADQETGLFSIETANGTVHADFQAIGSSDGRTWEWAWNNPHIEEKMKGDVASVREFGVREKISYLQTPQFAIPNAEQIDLMLGVAAKFMEAEGVFAGQMETMTFYIGLKNLRRMT